MKFPLFRRQRDPDTISALYGMIVAQARLPCFYRDYAVADTVNGRFDLIVLHLAFVLDRLSREPALRGLGQGVFDRFCQDMEHNLREMGISDLKVPQEMARIGEAFYGRQMAYLAAFAAPPPLLTEVLARNIYGGASLEPAAAHRLAAYIQVAVGDLRGQDAGRLAIGEIHFVDPSTIPTSTVKA